jgi:hypothetical protein
MSIRSIINFKDALDFVIGINIKLLAEGAMEISYCILKRDGDHVSLVDKKDELSDIDNLNAHLKPFIEKGVRIHVNCIGRSVLNKVTQGASQDSSLALQQWFPGIRKNDFVFQSFIKNDWAVLSLIRLEDIQKANLLLNNNATSLSLGIPILENLAPVMTEKSIAFEGFRVEFEEQQIKSIISSPEVPTSFVTIGNDSIPSSYLLAYASAMIFFLSTRALVYEGLPPVVADASQRYDAKKQIYTTGKWMIIALLVILPINLVLNFWLTEAVADTEASLQFQEGRKKSHQQNSSTTQKLNAAYEALGYKVNRLPLFFVDQVCATLPPGIQLNNLEAGLLNESIMRKDHRHQFDISQIKVEGISNDPIIANNWISDLGTMAWVDRVRDQKYNFDSRLGKGVFEFTILIKP